VAEKRLKIEMIESAPFAENTYIAQVEGQSQCVIIDPGFEIDPILAYIAAERLQPVAILNTHGHVDHIAGNDGMKRCWPDIPLMIGVGDASKLTNAMENLSGQYGFSILSPPADRLLEHGETIEVGGMTFEIRDAPGHSSGHIVFVSQDLSPCIVFGGDVLFQRGIGRTDFPDGSFEQLAEAIHTQLFTLPDDTVVFPGHGPSTTIGEEKAENPFVGAVSGFSL